MPDHYEPAADRPFVPDEVVIACIESGSSSLLLDANALPAAFFDLASGIAGELLHKLSVYRLRMACVLADREARPARFQEFVREADRGNQFRFFADRASAIQWLEAGD